MDLNKHSRWIGAMVFLGSTILAHSSVDNSELQKQYQGQVLTLRQFYPGMHLHFDAAGTLAHAPTPGAWTVDGQLKVEEISVQDEIVRIRGQRLFLFFDPHSNQMRDVGSVTKADKSSSSFVGNVDKWAKKAGKTEIEVDCGVAHPEMADVTKAMNAVFLAPGETLASVVPDFWKPFFSKTSAAQKASAAQAPSPKEGEPIFRVGGGVVPPKGIHTPDPGYSEPARSTRYQGTCVFYLEVAPDGTTQNIRLVRSLGMGLDEQAWDAVKRWKFIPAEKDGHAVRVAVNVEVSFHLQ